MHEPTTVGSGEKKALLISATEDEMFVAQILLDLPSIIRESESRPGFRWGSKKRRSRLDEGASPSRASSSLPPSFQKTEERKSEVKAVGSPVTPLSFEPSQSDEKKSRQAFNKSYRKRSKEEYLELVEELTQRRDLLRGEIKNVRKYYNKLNAYNTELKAAKQEVLNSCLRKKVPEMEISREMNLVMEFTQNHCRHHQNNVASHHALGPVTAHLYSSYNGLGSVHVVGPPGIPDISAREAFGVDASQPLDASIALADRRARFAEARRMRKGIIKIKSMRRACGIKLPESS